MFRQPPRFVTRTLIATLATVAFILSSVLFVVTLSVRKSAADGVVDRLRTGQRPFGKLEEQRARELESQLETLAENSTLKAALDTYQSELRTTNPAGRQDLVATIARELEKLAARIQPDVLEVRNLSGEVLGIAGRRADEWPAYSRVVAARQVTGSSILTTPSGSVFRVASVPIVLQGTPLGTLSQGSALDQRYANEIANLFEAQTVILSGDRVVASTLPSGPGMAIRPDVIRDNAGHDGLSLADSKYAVQLLLDEGGVQVYVLDSINASAGPAIQAALRTMGWIALGAFLLAALASTWLSRKIARPIDSLSKSLTGMTESRAFDQPLQPGGDSLEVDALTATFNTMIQSVKAAEAERLSAYVGTIRALALALDARDPYTAGHSERVSTVSLAIGRCLELGDAELEVLRLGALLHDIGKIGISDQVLLKPGPLTTDEFEQIKQHPVMGARILRTVPFLERHLAIVELHHERPDGKGYPHGLRGDEIPVLARIVHVADAFDAITSARAYRPARGAAEGLQELWRHAGSQFDAEAVQALAGTIPTLRFHENRIDRTAARAAHKTPLVAVTRS